MWAEAFLGAGLGLAAYAIANEGAFALTQRLDPTMATVVRNRYIAGGLLLGGGILLALESPVLGTGMAAGGLAALAGVQLVGLLGKVLDKPVAALPPGSQAQINPGTSGIRGLMNANGQQSFAGLLNAQGQQSFGGVFNGGVQQFSGLGDGSGMWDGTTALV